MIFTCVLLVCGSPSLSIQLPLALQEVEPSTGGLRYSLDHSATDELAKLHRASLGGLLLPSGTLVDLDLARIDHERLKWNFHVDGQPRPDLLEASALSVWQGSVSGFVGGYAMLAFSHYGVHGWIDTGSELVHVISRPAPSGDWTASDVLLVDEAALETARQSLPRGCVVAPATPASPQPAAISTFSTNAAALLTPSCALRLCTISIETDFQFFQRFQDVNAQATYIASLWSFISTRYESQTSTLLTFPYVGLHTTANDPWTTPDGPGSIFQMLTEFQTAWTGAIPGSGRLGHFMSGAALGGGGAFLNTLGSTTFNFGVSGNLDALSVFPIGQNPANWDFYVCAHEVGHAFNALHTHDYCPPLDKCESMQSAGPCQTSQVCTSSGTLMSYCVYCPGGAGNITTFFHPVSAQNMSAAAATHLPQLAQISGSEPTVAAPEQATPVTASVGGTPVGPVELVWRASPAMPWQRITMSSAGSGNYSASLPPFTCSETPNWFYTFTDAVCGALNYPASAPAAPLSLEVVSIATLVDDNFETDQGWTTSSNGTLKGLWERGVPIFDPSNSLAPRTDGDGSGQCWLTSNSSNPSTTFVTSGGVVQLTSPALDLSASGTEVRFLYFYRNNDAQDRLTVRVSQNGLTGPFVLVFASTTSSPAWQSLVLAPDDLLAAGIVPGPNMRVRIALADLGPILSASEGGVDGFRVIRRSCQSGIGTRYCTSLANSSGAPAQISASGTASVQQNNLVLQASPVPLSASGLFLDGVQPTQVPFGNGVKCITSPLRRLPVVQASGSTLAHAVNAQAGSAAGAILAGTTWHFQGWFRDNAAGGSGTNLSDGLRITFE